MIIPKYIMKRLFPDDCTKAVEGGVELTLVNVLSAISISSMPDDLQNYVEASIDGDPVSSDVMAQCSLTIEGGKTYTFDNAKEFENDTIPMGAKITIFAPIPLNQGVEHELHIVIKIDDPIDITIKRIVQ
ncbi:MAG TPA: hypothetical protein VKM55_07980 [Candidatus Lokiarchaeia archaeon]|nr:hypothetical protein [Candidatus Lokiarchaeia archaeon]